MATIPKNKSRLVTICVWNRDGRDSLMDSAIPTWLGGMPKQACARLIRGRAELLAGMDIVKKMDSPVSFGRNKFKAWQSEWAMVTSNGKPRRLLPLFPTSCDYAKLNEYFGKLRDEKSKFRNSGAILAIIYQFGKFCGWRNNE